MATVDPSLIARAAATRVLGRACGVVVGLGTQVLFFWTAFKLFLFLRDGATAHGEFAPYLDTFLTVQFSILHSVLLWPPAARRIRRWVPASFYGCFYCVVTCLSLLTLFAYWSGSVGDAWSVAGWRAHVISAAFFLSWAALFYSLRLTGLGFQTGWTQWCAWYAERPQPRREFIIRGAYRWMRHPVYFSFLGLIWFTPHMSWDHLLLSTLWTVYLGLGSWLKDERLAGFVGRPYREYQAVVPAYPLLRQGPLGRRPLEEEDMRPKHASDRS